MISVLLIDDHEIVSYGVKAFIEKDEVIEVDILSSGELLAKTLSRQSHDVYLVDLEMPDSNGIDVTKQILRVYPNAKVIIYTGHDIKPFFNKLVELGVSGMVSKTAQSSTLLNTIKSVVQNNVVLPLELFRKLRIQDLNGNATIQKKIALTEKELKILLEVEQGKSNKDIAGCLYMSKRTVEYALTSIFQKLGVHSRIEAIKNAKEMGII